MYNQTYKYKNVKINISFDHSQVPTSLLILASFYIGIMSLQTMKWKSSDLLVEPDVVITMFGWRIDHGVPHPCTTVDKFAPPELMEVVACGCSSQNACSRNTCSCKAAGLSCTSFCKCQVSDNCHNPHTKHQDNYSDEEEEETESDKE